MKIVAIIGADKISSTTAMFLAQNNFLVKLIGFSENEVDAAMQNLLIDLQFIEATEDKMAVLNNIITYTDILDGIAGAEAIIDTIGVLFTTKSEVLEAISSDSFNANIFVNEAIKNNLEGQKNMQKLAENLCFVDFTKKETLQDILISLQKTKDSKTCSH